MSRRFFMLTLRKATSGGANAAVRVALTVTYKELHASLASAFFASVFDLLSFSSLVPLPPTLIRM